MTFEERLDQLAEKHIALAQTVELLAIENRELGIKIDKLYATAVQDGENIRALARIAEIHERRITHIEGEVQ